MKVCIISHAYLEEAYQHALASLAAAQGVELAWIAPSRYRLALQNSSGNIGAGGCAYKAYGVPILFGGRQGTFLYRPFKLGRLLDEYRPDVVLHEQEVFALSAGQVARLCRARHIPLVMFVNENLPRVLAPPRRSLRKYVLSCCAGLICVSEGSARVHRGWGFDKMLTVLPQIGVHLSRTPIFGPRNTPSFHVGFAGRLVASKGVDVLLRAMSRLQSQGLMASCTIAGRGEQLLTLQKLASALDLNRQVTFTGMLQPDQLKQLLQTLDVLVLPSRRTKVWEEQFGRVLTEAMAEATVTVGSRTGAIAEVIGNNAMTFDEDDDLELASILSLLATNPEHLRDEQKRVYARVQSEYTAEVVTRKKLAFLADCAGIYAGF